MPNSDVNSAGAKTHKNQTAENGDSKPGNTVRVGSVTDRDSRSQAVTFTRVFNVF